MCAPADKLHVCARASVFLRVSVCSVNGRTCCVYACRILARAPIAKRVINDTPVRRRVRNPKHVCARATRACVPKCLCQRTPAAPTHARCAGTRTPVCVLTQCRRCVYTRPKCSRAQRRHASLRTHWHVCAPRSWRVWLCGQMCVFSDTSVRRRPGRVCEWRAICAGRKRVSLCVRP